MGIARVFQRPDADVCFAAGAVGGRNTFEFGAGLYGASARPFQRHNALAGDDLTQYIPQYVKSQYPDREIDKVYALERDGERVGYKVEYTPDSGKTVYFHPDGRRMAMPPEE